MVSSAACECGAEEQTIDHVVLQCLIHRPPHGLQGLTVLDDGTIEWLLNICPEIKQRLEELLQKMKKNRFGIVNIDRHCLLAIPTENNSKGISLYKVQAKRDPYDGKRICLRQAKEDVFDWSIGAMGCYSILLINHNFHIHSTFLSQCRDEFSSH